MVGLIGSQEITKNLDSWLKIWNRIEQGDVFGIEASRDVKLAHAITNRCLHSCESRFYFGDNVTLKEYMPNQPYYKSQTATRFVCVWITERNKPTEMEWLYPKRRAPHQTMSSISSPPLHFLMIFGIVITLLWFSQYTDYKSQLHHAASNFHFFLLLLPILLIFLIVSLSNTGRLCFRLTQTEHRHSVQRPAVSVSPWGVAILVLLLLILLWHHSSFQSKWFGPLWRSD